MLLYQRGVESLFQELAANGRGSTMLARQLSYNDKIVQRRQYTVSLRH